MCSSERAVWVLPSDNVTGFCEHTRCVAWPSAGKGCETNHTEPSNLVWGHQATCWLWNLHLKEHMLCPLLFYLWKDTSVLSRPLGGRTKECLMPKRTPDNLGMIMPHSTDWEQIPMCFPQGEMQSGCWELGFLCIWLSVLYKWFALEYTCIQWSYHL